MKINRLFALAILIALSSCTAYRPKLWAQDLAQQPYPKFEVASIKLHKPDVSGPPYTLTQLEGNQLGTVNAQVRTLIAWAYQLKPDQTKLISGLPSWADSKGFDIQAKAEGNPSRDQMLLMLRSLLADRFQLAVHTELRSVPVYALVQAKPGRLGPQLQRHSDATPCLKVAPGQPAPLSDFGAVPPLPPACGRFISGAHRLAGNNVTTQMIAQNLSQIPNIDRPVTDGTSLSERFDFNLTYTPDMEANPQQGGSANVAADPSSAPPFLAALREELGLKLGAATAKLSVLIVDHVEEPSPN